MSAHYSNKDENAPVEDDENILRRILNSEDYYNPSLDISVTPLAFKPTDNDINGISVYRSNFVTPRAIADAGKNPSGYHIAQLIVSDLIKLNMAVIPDPLPKTAVDYLPGHAAIPELNINDYRTNKKRMKALQLELAILASKSIVHSP